MHCGEESFRVNNEMLNGTCNLRLGGDYFIFITEIYDFDEELSDLYAGEG